VLSTYQYPKFEYVRPPEIAEGRDGHYPVVIVGAGPVGLCTAIDLARQGRQVLLLDNDDTVSIGSRATSRTIWCSARASSRTSRCASGTA